MFLKLYWLGAALALMPLPTQPQEIHHEKLFPYVPKDINNGTFPFNLTATTNSDMVLVKCPDSGYRHKNAEDLFARNSKVFIPESVFSPNSDLLAWVPKLRTESGQTKLKCGEIVLKDFGNPRYDWTYNVIWKNDTINSNFMKRVLGTNQISQEHQNCHPFAGNRIIFSSKKEGGFLLMKQFQNIQNFYYNQMFYYFEKFNSSEKINVPCGVTKIYGYAPKIKLRTPESILVLPTIGKILKVNSDGKDQQVIEVVLDMEGNTEYYRGEKITLARMRFVDGNELQVIENSTTSIKSKFIINGYEIIKLVYNFIDENENLKAIEKKYYFAPLEKDFIIKEEIFSYFNKNIFIKPNCSIYHLNVGYLDKIDYNGTKGSYQTLNSTEGIKGKFKIHKKSVTFNEKEDGKTTISCTYKTLDGSITTTTKFINEDTIAWIEKEKRNQILEDKRRKNESIKLKFIALEREKEIKQREKEEVERNWEEEKRENHRKLLEDNKSLYQKLSDKVGNASAILIIIGVVIFISFILYLPLDIIYGKFLSPFFKMLKNKKKYPNVYFFWKNLTNQPFHNYCMAITDKKYLSIKMLHPAFLKAVETDDEVDFMISNIYDDTLVDCHKNLPRKLQAHYVYTDAEERRYILSDGPRKDNQCSFWQMIYEEDIATIIAIIYDKKSEENDQASKDLYWKSDNRIYGDITVAHYKKIPVNVLSVTGYQILLERKGHESKSLKIYHVFNWMENDIPQSDLQFVSIYQEILKVAPKKNILIHSSQGTGARVFMLTYFACIYDSFKSDNESYCPLRIIKGIRDKRYGGNLVSYEFAYITKALVTALFNNKILVDFSSRRSDFMSSYDNYFYDYLKRMEQMGDELKEFLNFVNIVDKGKIYEYKSVFYTLGRIDPTLISSYCKRFQNAINNFLDDKDKKKFRYKNVQCLDSSAVTVNGKPKTDKDSFIHANVFEYATKNNKKRKMILCQAPLVDTIDDMLDMIIRYKISVVVILVKPEEASASEKKWVPYFPQENQVFETSNFCISKLKFKELDKDFTTETECHLRNKKNRSETKFTILHYHGWPDKTIPSEHMSIYSLYRRIISLRTDDYIAIHCSAGIGRTGTLALIIYLIDTINHFPTFDPIERLRCLREHRYLAVQRFNQFVFALLVVFEHHKKEINDMDSEAYDKFLKIAENVFKKEKELENKHKKKFT
uniref:Ig-like domain-containing protein n=1 Tax=Strongyloides venezuelensis TaxID=75913 RepID=A0A0K0F184_STRVS